MHIIANGQSSSSSCPGTITFIPHNPARRFRGRKMVAMAEKLFIRSFIFWLNWVIVSSILTPKISSAVPNISSEVFRILSKNSDLDFSCFIYIPNSGVNFLLDYTFLKNLSFGSRSSRTKMNDFLAMFRSRINSTRSWNPRFMAPSLIFSVVTSSFRTTNSNLANVVSNIRNRSVSIIETPNSGPISTGILYSSIAPY